jgi:hypothetical protein
VDHYEVQWCTDSGFSGCSGNIDTSNTNSYTHTAALTVGTWYFRVLASDAAGNDSAYTSAGSVVVQLPALQISAFSITPTNTGATVAWTTNFAGDTQVEYGEGVAGGAYGSTTTLADTGSGVTSHSTTLSNLVPCSTYHARALTTDVNSRSAQGTDTQFATTGCPGSATVTGSQTQDITFGVGGNLSFNDGDGQVTLVVPANATTANHNFQIQRLSAEALGVVALPAGRKAIAGRAYQFMALKDPSTATTTFDQPITVTMNYTDASVAKFKTDSLRIFSRDTGDWAMLDGCSVDTTAKTVSCTTTHFSSFALMGEENPLAAVLPETGAGYTLLLSILGGLTYGGYQMLRRRRTA